MFSPAMTSGLRSMDIVTVSCSGDSRRSSTSRSRTSELAETKHRTTTPKTFDHALGVFERQPLPKRFFARCKWLAAYLHDDTGDAAAVIRGAAPLTGHALMVTVDGEDIGPIDLEVNRIRQVQTIVPIRPLPIG